MTTQDLAKNAAEYVHHIEGCPAIGGNGDPDCICGAVQFLDLALSALHQQDKELSYPGRAPLIDADLTGHDTPQPQGELAQVEHTLVTQAKDLDPDCAAILDKNFDALLSHGRDARSDQPQPGSRDADPRGGQSGGA